MKIYTVKEGDSVFQIAKQYQISPEWIIAVNELKNPDELIVGQTLVIPYYATTYRVQSGDTLYGIAQQFNTSVRELYQNNPQLMGNPVIYPNETLVITYEKEPTNELGVNGYAYPFIDEAVLRKTLPYLTYLTVFTYGFRPDGSLIIPDDGKVLGLAKEYQVMPILLLSTLTESGFFDNQLASTLLKDISLQKKLIAELLSVMREKGYGAVDIDFEYLNPAESKAFEEFMELLKEEMEQQGFGVIVSLPPKNGPQQQGLQYEAYSYPNLGAIADRSTIMAYEWGYLYGPPMAVAPLDKVEDVVNYATEVIDRNRIWLGTPNYGYDFTLPYQKDVSVAKALSNEQALLLAQEVGSEIQYDATAQAPYFTYYDQTGKEHIVWFEDARSVNATMDLIDEYGIKGISVWNIMKYFPAIWQVIQNRYRIMTADFSNPISNFQ